MPKSTDSHITKSTTPEAEVLVRVEGVSKKFCKDLKRSLWYGIQDITSELFGLKKKEGLRKDEFWAVSDVSFELKRGECLGLIGHNGAGKSTLLKILNGLIKPDKGRITMKGRIAALIELGAGFNPILTGRENVFNNAAVLGFTQEETLEKYQDIVEFAELGEFMDTPVQNYSSGMKVRLGFAVAAQMEPDVLIIDEVLAVGDLAFQIKCYNAIGTLMKNTVLIFVSHSMPHVSRISNRALLLTKGRVIVNSEDIGLVVDTYYKGHFTGDLEVVSSGKIALISSSIKIGSNDWLNHGDEVILDGMQDIGLQFHFNNQSNEVHYIRIVIFSLDGRAIMDCNSKEGEFYLLPGQNRFQTILKNIYLKSSKYTLSIILTEIEQERSPLRINYVLPFQVKDKIASWADTRVIGEWS